MTRAPRPRPASRTLAFAAVALALVTGCMHGGSAEARRVGFDEVGALRVELAQARADLSAYQNAYGELMNGLDRIARISYGRVLDPESWLRVYGAIEYTSNRQALRERLGVTE